MPKSFSRLWLGTPILLCVCVFGATPEIEITLANGSRAETETRDQLQRLLKAYDLSGWIWTRKVVID